jgi:hypothetical protein
MNKKIVAEAVTVPKVLAFFLSVLGECENRFINKRREDESAPLQSHLPLGRHISANINARRLYFPVSRELKPRRFFILIMKSTGALITSFYIAKTCFVCCYTSWGVWGACNLLLV